MGPSLLQRKAQVSTLAIARGHTINHHVQILVDQHHEDGPRLVHPGHRGVTEKSIFSAPSDPGICVEGEILAGLNCSGHRPITHTKPSREVISLHT